MNHSHDRLLTDAIRAFEREKEVVDIYKKALDREVFRRQRWYRESVKDNLAARRAHIALRIVAVGLILLMAIIIL